MIDDDEIDAKATEMGVHVANVERDYVFGWLLKCFYENAFLGSVLIFKGGNCMRKAYFPAIRFSGDLDFSVLTAIDPERFQREINAACAAAQELSGVTFELDKTSFKPDRMIDAERQSFKGRVYFKDFYDEPGEIVISVRLDMTEYDRLYLPTVKRRLIHPYSDQAECSIDLHCMSLEELVANKLKCLIQRRHSFDLYDLVYATFFDRSIEINRSQVLRTFLQKTIFEPSPGAAKSILLGLPMAFFKTAWNKYVAPVGGRLEFDKAAEGFVSSINEIFGPVSDRWGHQPFYPAELRNLILEAGASRRIMRLQYDGHTREVEPYSLSYKRPKGKSGSEYFYVWDLSGGATSGPGIKTFFHEKIRNLEITDKTFEPRYPIELSKAGEASHKDYFGKPFSAGTAKIRRQRTRKTVSRAIRGFGVPSYTVECPYCQKRFKRSSPTTALNPHKQDNGYPCHGRTGYFV